MPAIYRKYRPQTFADLIGQEHIATTIKNEITMGRLSHAYLFSGPRGVGKTTLARLLAKAVNCQKRKPDASEPCNECSSCAEIATGRNIDVLEIDAASHTGVENVRENIIDSSRFQPAQSPYKVFIIDEVHMLSGSAFNALLKTLEEPPAHVIFILATTELHKLPATIISRCQRFQFKKIAFAAMLARLKKISAEENIKVDKDVLERVVAKSEGCLRDAESLLGQVLTLANPGGKISSSDAEFVLPATATEDVIEFSEHLLRKHPAEALAILAKVSAEGVSWDQFALDVLSAGRIILFLQAGVEPAEATADISPELLKRLKKLSTEVPGADVQRALDALLLRRVQIKTAPLPQLPLELLAVTFAAVAVPAPALPSAPLVAATNPPTKQTAPGPAPEPKNHSLKKSLKSALETITGHHPPTTTVEQIQAKWGELIASITAQNHSLTFILSMCTLASVTANGLHLVFPYSLHKEKVEEHKNKKIIENCLEQAFGERIQLVCEVISVGAPATATADSELTSLALEFGGEVVN